MVHETKTYIRYIKLDSSENEFDLYRVKTTAAPPLHRDCVFVDNKQYYVSHVIQNVVGDDELKAVPDKYVAIEWLVYLKKA